MVSCSAAEVECCCTQAHSCPVPTLLQEAEGGALASCTGTLRWSSGLIADQKRTAAALVRVSKMLGKVKSLRDRPSVTYMISKLQLDCSLIVTAYQSTVYLQNVVPQVVVVAVLWSLNVL